MIPSAGYFKELEIFISKSGPKKFIFIAVKGKLRMSNLVFLSQQFKCKFTPKV